MALNATEAILIVIIITLLGLSMAIHNLMDEESRAYRLQKRKKEKLEKRNKKR